MSGKKNNVGKCNVETNVNIQQEHHSLSNIACKPSPKKTSGTANCDLNRISSIIDDRKVTMTVKGQKSNGLKGDLFMTGKNQKSVADKKNKAKKMSQQLSRMLKQEKNKSSGGSLTDFLSSLWYCCSIYIISNLCTIKMCSAMRSICRGVTTLRNMCPVSIEKKLYFFDLC